MRAILGQSAHRTVKNCSADEYQDIYGKKKIRATRPVIVFAVTSHGRFTLGQMTQSSRRHQRYVPGQQVRRSRVYFRRNLGFLQRHDRDENPRHIVLETCGRQPESLFLESRATAFQRHHLRR